LSDLELGVISLRSLVGCWGRYGITRSLC